MGLVQKGVLIEGTLQSMNCTLPKDHGGSGKPRVDREMVIQGAMPSTALEGLDYFAHLLKNTDLWPN